MLALIHNFCNAFFSTVALDQRRHPNKIRRFYATCTTTTANKDNNSTYDFFNSIGRPRFISAPMVDQSSLSWRLLVKKNGADLAFSQMMHAKIENTGLNVSTGIIIAIPLALKKKRLRR